MFSLGTFLTTTICLLSHLPTSFAFGVQNYPNLFFAASTVVSNQWFSSVDSRWAREMSEYWAQTLIQYGPWSVTNKSYTAKSGDKKDYLSWAVYHWPDCSNVQNTTELTEEEVWDECDYVVRDGKVNPDIELVKDKQALQNMSNSVYLSAMAYLHTNDSQYTTHINHALHTFFINNDTRMNPNLNYAQVIRGPGDQMGRHTGVLDLACMAKIVSGVQVMRSIKPAEWQQETETGIMQWASEQLNWLYTSEQGLGELNATNNHGTFAVNQVCALNVLLNQNDACVTALEDFYNGIYLDQIASNGDQPLESARTRPYHYRAFNLMALVTNAQFGDFVGLSPSAWERRSAANTTIVDALHFAMLQNYTASNELTQSRALNPVVAAISAKYGDPDNKYANFLKSSDPYFPGQPWFALNEGLSDAGIKQGLLETTYGPVPSQPTLGAGSPDDPNHQRKRNWKSRGTGWPTVAPKAP
ncbi:hypothetical protein CNBG_0394 [Cryptococcus deuterogattii R265]|uniref:Alginate lyase domain-containing protein n=1 Tax=Cryptococcus deuterogattii (strain R265) TaxID=294750 RepID=A0A095CZ26_CRYD2|nr:hypothetical protein CNBG_0394 [Cryptococcus deuterogattii R265]KIR25384.1 hypothetical protein I309_05754 [Cryptococcus deuterogattii LA55]KIR33725.1 hypothetical protein I352_03802 [Cryptococcus deuterogattii MMRL2647]KIR74404.1 hypothetical protein I310_02011 [Cryptococcus deuterogattii CA1014]KIR94108.1 hypothetical protein I304_01740 [Cryptococcus deuterogattii CBS 10090]KIS01115.1 hypothetical protein L804_00984 [Cryptococcus deuterogattii 2001/935-1]